MWKARLVLVTFKNKHAFLSELNTALNGWQYSLPPLTRKKIDLPTPEKEKDFIIYKHAGMDPSIWIQAEDDNAKILGPNNTMKKLEKRLRQKPETCVIIGARL